MLSFIVFIHCYHIMDSCQPKKSEVSGERTLKKRDKKRPKVQLAGRQPKFPLIKTLDYLNKHAESLARISRPIGRSKKSICRC